MLRLFSALILLAMVVTGCSPDPASEPSDSAGAADAWPEPVITAADSVAWKALEAVGGADAWRSLPYLRFDFGIESGGEESFRRHHFWDRLSGNYRFEQDGGEDSTYVVLFNTATREGAAYLNGEALTGEESSDRVGRAYSAFINDTYWLLMPAKLLDPGVNRTLDADSSDADTAVLHLTFGDVGLTPGDTYWVWVDRASGLVQEWAYVLEGRPDAPPARWEWANWAPYASPAGQVMMAGAKVGRGRSILTDAIATPATVDAGMFSDPSPRLD